MFFTAAVRTFLECSDFSRGLTTEFIANIHLIKCKLLQLTFIFLGKEKIYNPSLTVDMTSAGIMQYISLAKQRSGFFGQCAYSKAYMRNSRA